MSFYRNQSQMARCQAAYDNMLPPEYWEDDDECIDEEEPEEPEQPILGEG